MRRELTGTATAPIRGTAHNATSDGRSFFTHTATRSPDLTPYPARAPDPRLTRVDNSRYVRLLSGNSSANQIIRQVLINNTIPQNTAA